jgi:DNA-binding NtrC family response regulator
VPGILLIDDDEDLLHLLRAELEALGYQVCCLARADLAPARLESGRYDVVLLDNLMPGMSGIDFLKGLRERGLDIPVILMTGESTPDTAIQATKLGAFDYVVKPGTVQELARELEPLARKALEIVRPVQEVRVSPVAPAVAEGPALVGGKSRRMLDVYRLVAQFADSGDPVLIRGETGTGKELVARAVHTNGPRKGRPFVALNCTALNENLLESELFGHEKGAFTHAEKLRKGKIEYASGGTLFLDEIGDMPLNLQAKLLRVLEYQEVERLGSNEPIKVDVRVLSATHRDMEAAIQEGKFRRDLFYRLNRVTVRLPPLRERLEDLPELVAYFLTRAAEAISRPRPAVADATLAKLRAYHWPGNVRELQNVVFRAVGVCRGPQVLPSHVEFAPDAPGPGAGGDEGAALAGLARAIEWAWNTDQPDAWPLLRDMLERELLRFYLAKLGGNQTEVHRRLKMSRTTLVERMKKHELG